MNLLLWRPRIAVAFMAQQKPFEVMLIAIINVSGLYQQGSTKEGGAVGKREKDKEFTFIRNCLM